MKILVTGGAGYIGSHACVELLNAGYDVVVLDNYSNSSVESLRRVEVITGKRFPIVEGDIRDSELLDAVFAEHRIDGVIHFAGLKSVGESCSQPLNYFDNNVNGTLKLCEAMQRAGCKTLVFSSSATVYGDPDAVPIDESSATRTTNPYGRTKLMVEQVLEDLSAADSAWRIARLRYFNPVGAHPSGTIGEDPNGIPNNLLPYIAQVAVGRLANLGVFGSDYPTLDGTGVRDYIHVVDLVLGHLRALEYLAENGGLNTWNLGTGNGYSVLQMVEAFEKASGKPVPYTLKPRRPGDIAACYADPKKAREQLGWQAERGLPQMMEDTWRWQSQNPDGYR